MSKIFLHCRRGRFWINEKKMVIKGTEIGNFAAHSRKLIKEFRLPDRGPPVTQPDIIAE